MDSNPTEPELVAAIDRCDELMRLCAAGHLSFEDFCAQYDNFYWLYALDGHESDATGLAMLAKYAERLSPHQAVTETILTRFCSDADAAKESYSNAGRFCSAESVDKLKLVAAGLSSGEA